MLRFPVRPKPVSELEQATKPGSVQGGQAEALAWTFFDTALYESGVTTRLPFFTTARANRQLTNLDTPGQLPSPQYFEIHYFGLDLLIPPADGAWLDAHRLLMGAVGDGGPTWEFELANKSYGIFPLTFLHESGGQRGFGFSTNTDDAVEYARNAVPDGGWCVDGSIIIPPQEGFNVELTWENAVTLTGENPNLRFWMAGSLYRRVL